MTTQTILIIAVTILILFSSYSHYRFLILEKKLKILFRGKKVQDLETKILLSLKQIDEALNTNEVIMRRVQKVEDKLDTALIKKALIRYNPFSEVGSNQSFSLCLLDSRNDGVVISALYSRGVSNFYSKEIHAGIPKQNLSDEEEQAFDKAIKDNQLK